jgi:hypothetical protein
MNTYYCLLSIFFFAIINNASFAASHSIDGFTSVNLNQKSNIEYVSICAQYTYFKVYMPDACNDLVIQGLIFLL